MTTGAVVVFGTAILLALYRLRSLIVATQAENQAKLDALAALGQKIKAEVQALKDAANAGQTLDFSGVDQVLGEVDAINEDAPPPVEPTP